MKVFTFEMGEVISKSNIPKSHKSFIKDCSHSGSCDADVTYWKQFFQVDDKEALREYLRNVTDWDVSDDGDNLDRLIWIVAGDLAENGECYLA